MLSRVRFTDPKVEIAQFCVKTLNESGITSFKGLDLMNEPGDKQIQFQNEDICILLEKMPNEVYRFVLKDCSNSTTINTSVAFKIDPIRFIDEKVELAKYCLNIIEKYKQGFEGIEKMKLPHDRILQATVISDIGRKLIYIEKVDSTQYKFAVIIDTEEQRLKYMSCNFTII